MPPDTSKHGAQDATRVALHQEWEVHCWVEQAGSTKAQPEKAVNADAPGATAVEKYLKR